MAMDQPIRVRFAPSPTGFLHIGGARTALFNWLSQGIMAEHSSFGSTIPMKPDPPTNRCRVSTIRWSGLDLIGMKDQGLEGRTLLIFKRSAVISMINMCSSYLTQVRPIAATAPLRNWIRCGRLPVWKSVHKDTPESADI